MAAAVVATADPISYPGTMTQPLVQDPFALFTTPQTSPVLIETVHLFCDYGGGQPSGDMWILRLLDKSGHILCTQATPAFTVNDIPGDVEVCWMRGGAEVSATPITDSAANLNLNYTGFATLPLPDLILDTQSVLQLQLIQNITGGGSSAFVIAAPVVTYDDGGSSAAADALTGIPLLTDTSP